MPWGSSAGVQVFQFETLDIGPVKFIRFMDWGQSRVLVQSQRRRRFLMVVIFGFWGESWWWEWDEFVRFVSRILEADD